MFMLGPIGEAIKYAMYQMDDANAAAFAQYLTEFIGTLALSACIGYALYKLIQGVKKTDHVKVRVFYLIVHGFFVIMTSAIVFVVLVTSIGNYDPTVESPSMILYW